MEQWFNARQVRAFLDPAVVAAAALGSVRPPRDEILAQLSLFAKAFVLEALAGLPETGINGVDALLVAVQAALVSPQLFRFCMENLREGLVADITHARFQASASLMADDEPAVERQERAVLALEGLLQTAEAAIAGLAAQPIADPDEGDEAVPAALVKRSFQRTPVAYLEGWVALVLDSSAPAAKVGEQLRAPAVKVLAHCCESLAALLANRCLQGSREAGFEYVLARMGFQLEPDFRFSMLLNGFFVQTSTQAKRLVEQIHSARQLAQRRSRSSSNSNRMRAAAAAIAQQQQHQQQPGMSMSAILLESQSPTLPPSQPPPQPASAQIYGLAMPTQSQSQEVVSSDDDPAAGLAGSSTFPRARSLSHRQVLASFQNKEVPLSALKQLNAEILPSSSKASLGHAATPANASAVFTAPGTDGHVASMAVLSVSDVEAAVAPLMLGVSAAVSAGTAAAAAAQAPKRRTQAPPQPTPAVANAFATPSGSHRGSRSGSQIDMGTATTAAAASSMSTVQPLESGQQQKSAASVLSTAIAEEPKQQQYPVLTATVAAGAATVAGNFVDFEELLRSETTVKVTLSSDRIKKIEHKKQKKYTAREDTLTDTANLDAKRREEAEGILDFLRTVPPDSEPTVVLAGPPTQPQQRLVSELPALPLLEGLATEVQKLLDTMAIEQKQSSGLPAIPAKLKLTPAPATHKGSAANMASAAEGEDAELFGSNKPKFAHKQESLKDFLKEFELMEPPAKLAAGEAQSGLRPASPSVGAGVASGLLPKKSKIEAVSSMMRERLSSSLSELLPRSLSGGTDKSAVAAAAAAAAAAVAAQATASATATTGPHARAGSASSVSSGNAAVAALATPISAAHVAAPSPTLLKRKDSNNRIVVPLPTSASESAPLAARGKSPSASASTLLASPAADGKARAAASGGSTSSMNKTQPQRIKKYVARPAATSGKELNLELDPVDAKKSSMLEFLATSPPAHVAQPSNMRSSLLEFLASEPPSSAALTQSTGTLTGSGGGAKAIKGAASPAVKPIAPAAAAAAPAAAATKSSYISAADIAAFSFTVQRSALGDSEARTERPFSMASTLNMPPSQSAAVEESGAMDRRNTLVNNSASALEAFYGGGAPSPEYSANSTAVVGTTGVVMANPLQFPATPNSGNGFLQTQQQYQRLSREAQPQYMLRMEAEAGRYALAETVPVSTSETPLIAHSAAEPNPLTELD